ncbi:MULTISPECIES: glyoxalase [Mammaliicoccus]|uniref:Glyoxalase n=1 Tax=Mammaliicoccus fleurettii TaxID=150056 RepID=A0ABS5MJX8_9STAP|nr:MULTISPECIES: glyoxalase [Mammaliicoccus]HCN60060.1 glyoxalase [Staphylococcus sp.]MBL0847483.1 glyoxalase [Mammaliicoccus fleurettii]MBS3671640.1 glyoxalase [Mammaliicoccus fleurettii]MBS3696209.1 glyoxalase [Mammaliicoccus fleurettii]MEB6201908.1 glyoxalase [Mammaliicoccus fleurettii]
MYKLKMWDHVQLSAPKGSEGKARTFYVDQLGFNEVEKPESLKGNGGVWFNINNIDLHIGIEEDFIPLKKAHPAINVENLEDLIEHLTEEKLDFKTDNRFPGAKRLHLYDPFSNRLEFIEKQ